MYALLLAAVVATGIAAAQVAPMWSTMMRREREAELEFRLGEYRRAIARYRADHNRYPRSLADLLADGSRLERRRYLRRLYPDPMTGLADWALDVVLDPSGRVAGIKDVRSRSAGVPLRVIEGKASYRDW